MALDYQTEKQGGLGFYPGSHKLNIPHHKSDTVGFSSGISEMDLQSFEIYNPVFQPGDLVFHHCNIVHAAMNNSTEETRSNVAIRLFPAKPIFDEDLRRKYEIFKNSSKRVE